MEMSPEQHGEHMQKMIDGLKAILASQDVNEIHQIAQQALAEEQAEQKTETEQPGLREKLMQAAGEGE